MIFKDAWVLLFLPVIIFFLYLWHKKDIASGIRFPSAELIENFRPTFKLALAKRMLFLRAIVAILLLLTLARPRLPQEETKVQAEGIDIVLAIDASGSMLAEDFKIHGKRQNRLAVAKGVVEDFIKMRKTDRIGMIAFAARAYTVCPLTLDYAWLIKNLERIKIGTIEDGTAIGSGISSSLNRLKDSTSKTRIIVLLTDGINNTGNVSPLTAAEAAHALGIKVYAIGAGTRGLVPYPVKDFFGRKSYKNVKIEIDEETLKKVAALTGGKYFRATDTVSLQEIYQEIDELEKTKVEEAGFQHYQELFSYLLIPGILLLLSEVILSNSILRRLP